MSSTAPAPEGWSGAWPDAVAFALGLAMAWWFGWNTTDLVWSLWLSSLVVGYALIVRNVSAPLRELLVNMHADRAGIGGPGAKGVAIALFAGGTLFGLAFFTVHFGGFHFVHSVFLNLLFPIDGEPMQGFPGWAVYREVLARYWWFLPAAFLAERHAFRRPLRDPDVAVATEAIAARKAKGDAMMQPYRNVIRMHLLIFFFVGAHFLRLENFIVYAVVYAVYFFPWRLLRREKPAAALTA
ncbi:MAG TPA: DUF6498-containing protein [Opitutaceae bacterium]|nr:DUF6498-containing protein [Opitutaceae bacterium]